MRTSERGIKLIKKYETLKLSAYQDAAGIWTIGYGHTNGVQRCDRVNETGATEMLKEDLTWAESRERTETELHTGAV